MSNMNLNGQTPLNKIQCNLLPLDITKGDLFAI